MSHRPSPNAGDAMRAKQPVGRPDGGAGDSGSQDELANELERAIREGDAERAAQLAGTLAHAREQLRCFVPPSSLLHPAGSRTSAISPDKLMYFLLAFLFLCLPHFNSSSTFSSIYRAFCYPLKFMDWSAGSGRRPLCPREQQIGKFEEKTKASLSPQRNHPIT